MRALTEKVLDELLEHPPLDATVRFESAPETRAEWERVIAREHAEAAIADGELAAIARECLRG